MYLLLNLSNYLPVKPPRLQNGSCPLVTWSLESKTLITCTFILFNSIFLCKFPFFIKKIHEFGFLPTASDFGTDPGARGAAYYAYSMMGLIDRVKINKIWHWSTTDYYVASNKSLLNGLGWILSVYEKMADGEAYILTPETSSTVGTKFKAMASVQANAKYLFQHLIPIKQSITLKLLL